MRDPRIPTLDQLTALRQRTPAQPGRLDSAPGTSPQSPDRPQTVSVPPMGQIYNEIQPAIYQSFERHFRKAPDPNFYVALPGGFSFELGLIEPQRDQVLLVTNYKISAARLAGIAAGDTIPVEPERFSTCWGFDLTVGGTRSRNCTYELDPQPIAVGQQAAVGPPSGRTGPPAFYARQRANAYSQRSGAGRSLLPFRAERYGSPSGPFTIVAKDGASVSVRCAIFKPIPVPLAYVEVRLSGYLLPDTLWSHFESQITP